MKIDVTKIDGYEEMDAEAKLNALLNYEVEVPQTDNAEVAKYKAMLSKVNSEAAEYKNKWRATLSEQERLAQEQAEALAEKDKKLAAYERMDKIHQFENNFLSLGYDKELARATAEAQLDGNFDIVFANQKIFQESQKKAWEDDRLNHQPNPSVGKPITSKDIEDKAVADIMKYAMP